MKGWYGVVVMAVLLVEAAVLEIAEHTGNHWLWYLSLVATAGIIACIVGLYLLHTKKPLGPPC